MMELRLELELDDEIVHRGNYGTWSLVVAVVVVFAVVALVQLILWMLFVSVNKDRLFLNRYAVLALGSGATR